MAEGGVKQSPVKLKPVPPPKPAGTTLASPKNVVFRRPSDTPVKASHEYQSVLSPEIDADKSKNASLECGSEIFSIPSQKFLSKPPLLPKPLLASIQSRRTDRSSKCDPQLQSTATVISSTSGVTRKIPSKLFIPEPKSEDINNGTRSGLAKAPVAKLDEFDHGDRVSPVRPPRSPKHKILIGGPFLSEVAQRQQQLLATHQSNVHLKSCSLGRNVSPAELKIKTASLGRTQVQAIAQVLENAGSCFRSEERSPVRPPRRRNKSFTQSPEVLSPSKDVEFSFDAAEPRIPVYAQVNYNLKKNRRSKDDPSITEIVQDGVKLESCRLEIKTNDTIIGGMTCGSENILQNVVINNSLCNISGEETEDCESAEKEEVVESDYTYFSFTSNVITTVSSPINTNKINKVNSSEGHAMENCINNVNHQNQDVSGSHASKCIKNEMCPESCADCLPAQILEQSLDDSLSSSKLEWQSVRSSFNSSGSESNFAISAGVPDTLNSSKCAEEKESKSDITNCSMEKSHEKVFVNNESFGKSDTDSSIISGLTNVSSIKLDSPSSDRRIYKRLTSSLPTRKSYRRPPRRQSWTGYKDSAHYGEWKQTTWVDEGDSSSGNLGDLDSSDTNVGKQSSVEEVDSKVKSDQSVSKRFNLWLSSFGKSGKKSRSAKRHSQFYCEKQDSLKGGPTIKDKIDDNLEHLSSAIKSPVSGPTIPDVSDVNHHMNSKVTSEESIASDMQSDSDGECGDDSYQDSKEPVPKQIDHSKKAFYIANELMTSERVFIKALKLLNVNFREAVVRANASGHPVISTSEFDKILNSLPQLQSLNEHLLGDLEQRIQNWSSHKKIADVIVKKGPFLKLYATYIQNYEAQCNYFDECCQKYPKFAKVVKEFESLPICQKLTIKHYMLKPVQRIPQYRLLLDDYCRHLDPSSPDFEDTQNALKIVCEVADHANRSIKLGDHLSVLLQLQSQLGNHEIIKPGRVLLKDGELYKLSRKEHQPRYFILLNDCLLYTSYYGSGPSSGLKVNSEISLAGMKVSIPQAEDYHNEFSIISSTRSFTLSARSSQERQEWVEAFQKAIQEYTSRQLSFQVQKLNVSRPDGSHDSFKLGKEAPIWIQDGRVTKCQLCVAEFTVTFRRHHCRACGKVVCGMCSAFRAPLQYMQFQPDRVCEDCYNTLRREFDNSPHMADIIKQERNLKKCDATTIVNIRAQFKKLGPSSGKKTKKNIPQRLLEVTANDTGSQMCGWLQRRSKRSWKRLWFVLKEQVLYVYKASEDVVALETIPVLGYKVEPMKQNHFQLYEGIDAKLVFQLTHPNQPPLAFSAESENLVNRWIAELQEATVLK